MPTLYLSCFRLTSLDPARIVTAYSSLHPGERDYYSQKILSVHRQRGWLARYYLKRLSRRFLGQSVDFKTLNTCTHFNFFCYKKVFLNYSITYAKTFGIVSVAPARHAIDLLKLKSNSSLGMSFEEWAKRELATKAYGQNGFELPLASLLFDGVVKNNDYLFTYLQP